MSRPTDWLVQDLCQSVRARVRNVSSTAIIAITIAVGLACNAIAFSLTRTLLLRPYPFHQLERLVLLREGRAGDATLSIRLAAGDLNDVHRESTVFDDFARYRYVPETLVGQGDPVRARSFHVSANLFQMLGVEALRGRTLTPTDGSVASNRVAVLSFGFWQRQFGGDPRAVGRRIVLNDKAHDVVGIMPSWFNFPRGADLWLPLELSPAEEQERLRSTLSALGRLRQGTTVRDAQAELDRYADILARRHPTTNAGRRLAILPLREEQYEYTLPFFSMLEIAALFVLLVVAINAGNIFLTERWAHRREQVMRLTLGATRGRLILGGVTDAMLLAGLGTVLAIPFSWFAVRAIRDAMPRGIAIYVAGWDTLQVDASVLIFSVATAAVVALGLGWIASFSVPSTLSAVDVATREITAVDTRRFGRVAVVVQLVAALVLLSVGAAVLSGFSQVTRVFHALDPNDVLIAGIALPEERYPSSSSQARFFTSVLDAVREIPSVETVGMTSNLPASNVPNARTSFEIERRPPASPAGMPTADLQTIGGALLPLLRVRLLSGRNLLDSDVAESTRAAVISNTMARLHWPGEEALGKRIRLGSWGEQGAWWTIVGVVADLKQNWFDPTPRAIVYVPMLQRPVRSMTLLARTGGDPHRLAQPVREALKRLDPSLALSEVATLKNEIDDSIAPIRIVGTVLMIFASVTLAIAAIGVYGILSATVTRQTREVGVRMALGAPRAAIAFALMSDTFRVWGWSLMFGLPVSVWLHATVGSRLYNLVSVSPMRLAGLSFLLLGISLVAAFVPARRAASVDPAVALRAL